MTKVFAAPAVDCFVEYLFKETPIPLLSPFYTPDQLEAGIDEAGRGCYAGPVCAAAVILPPQFYHPLLNDSKKLREKDRDLLRPIIEREALAFCVAMVDEGEIDRINILQATYIAMHKAVAGLSVRPDFLLIDGNRFKPFVQIPHQCFVKGDGRFASIAAASILAKTHRDELVMQLHREFPQYGWDKNKTYGTAIHRQAIASYGLCKYHRKSFNIVSRQLPLL